MCNIEWPGARLANHVPVASQSIHIHAPLMHGCMAGHCSYTAPAYWSDCKRTLGNTDSEASGLHTIQVFLNTCCQLYSFSSNCPTQLGPFCKNVERAYLTAVSNLITNSESWFRLTPLLLPTNGPGVAILVQLETLNSDYTEVMRTITVLR